MTTFPKALDKLLYETIHAIFEEDKHLDLVTIKDLLKSGANPKAEISGVKNAAYQLVQSHNKGGKYNAIIEIFDEYCAENPREMDSVGEGMHLKPDE